MIRTILLLFFILFSGAMFGLDLVKDSKPAGEIILPVNPSKAEAFGAEELQYWVREITGATIPVLNVPSKIVNTKLFIGKKLADAWHKELATLAGSDGFAIRHNKNNIYVFGDHPRGTAYGIYHLLEANTDIIWARPNQKFGTVFSKTPNLKLTKLDILEKPVFQLRGWNVCTLRKHKPTGLWIGRNRGNYSHIIDTSCLELMTIAGSGHGLRLIAPPKKYLVSNPEFFAWNELAGGRTPSTICLSNHKLPAVGARELAKIVKKSGSRHLWIGMPDSWVVCRCPECQKPIKLADGSELKMRDPYPAKDPVFHSTQYFNFLNKVAVELKKEYPDIKLLVLAYIYAAEPPACELNDAIWPMFAPYPTKNDRYPMSSDKQDELWKKRFESWRQKTPNLCFYEYYSPNLRQGVESSYVYDLRDLAACGGKGVLAENGPDIEKLNQAEAWDLNSIDNWLLTRLFWNPEQDPAKLRDYYLQRTFREAAPMMKRFYAMLREGWEKNSRSFNCHTSNKAIFNALVIAFNNEKKCFSLLDEAEKKAKHPNSKEIIKRLKRAVTKVAASLHRVIIPELPDSEASRAAIEFDSPYWNKAHTMPAFKRVRIWNPAEPKQPTEVRIMRNKNNLYLRYCAVTDNTAIPKFMPTGEADIWPMGEHGEIYLKHKKGEYLFAFDANNNKYDAKDFDRRWNSSWQLNTRKTNNGWDAIVTIPIDEITNKKNNKNAALSLFILRHHNDSSGPSEDSSLNGGILQRDSYPVIIN